MIAQINCAELPKNELYPKTGILQFWIDSGEEEGDENWGFNANDIANQANIRVIYYPQVGEAAPVGHPAVTAARSEDWPIYPPEAELALTFKKKHESLSDTSREFEARFVHRWNEKHPEQTINEVYEIDRLHDGENIAYDLTDSTEYHKLGGYPSFVQSDPRENNPELQEYTVNLLTIASEEAKNDGDGVQVEQETAQQRPALHQDPEHVLSAAPPSCRAENKAPRENPSQTQWNPNRNLPIRPACKHRAKYDGLDRRRRGRATPRRAPPTRRSPIPS